MFYYVSLEQKQHLDFGGKQRAARACEQYKYHREKTRKIQKISINSPKFQINLKDKKKGVIEKNCYLLVSKENSA